MSNFLRIIIIFIFTYSLFADEGVGDLKNSELEFDNLQITASKPTEEQKPFTTPNATSTRVGISSNTQSIDSIVRSMPGAYTNTDQAQGTLQVNIRGMTGFGRVNTTIDGVTQSFFGASADDGRFHDQTGTQAFGALVDSNFLVSVDVQRGTFSGGNANALMGSANFKTIGVDDIVNFGNSFGFLGRFSYGTNGIGGSYMGSVAAKNEFDNGGFVGVLFGYSGKKITQDYTTGAGNKINEPNSSAISSTINPQRLTQKPQSILAKLEYAPNSFTKSILSYRKYTNNLAGRKINNDNYQINLNYNPNNLLHLKALFAYNQGIQSYKEGGTYALAEFGNDIKSKNKAYTFDISQLFESQFKSLNLHTMFGFNALFNSYENTLDLSEASLAGGGLAMSPFQPRGKQELLTYYMDNSLNLGIFTLDINANLLHWRLKGYRPSCDEANFYCFPKEASNINKNGLKFNSSFIFYAQIHELFMPFISYAHTSRVPNVQEMFFSNNAGNGINPHLKPETAQTYQIGFNAFKHGIFKTDDILGFKGVYYRTIIKNFIYNEQFYLEDENGNSSQFYMHLNLPEKTIFEGVELEMSYDMGFVFIKSTYARQNTDSTLSQNQFQMFGSNNIMQLPKDYANIELRLKASDKIAFGTIIKYTGKAKRINPNQDEWEQNPNNEYYPNPSLQNLPKIPTIVDVYWTMQWLKNLSTRFEVQNLFDKNYMDALNAYNSSATQYDYDANNKPIYFYDNAARGLTLMMSFEWRY